MAKESIAPLPTPEDWKARARILAEALPYLRRYAGHTFVVKYGGNAMGGADAEERFAGDVVLLKLVGINPIVVHGGGPQIGQMLDRLSIKSQFVDGLRVTDQAAIEVVEMVLSGAINKGLVSAINAAGGKAMGLSGKDGNLIVARKLQRFQRDPQTGEDRVLDFGFVGEPQLIKADILHTLARSDLIPVIAPIGVGRAGETYNINADTAAGAIAAAVGATRLLLLTDVPGVLDRNKVLIPDLTVEAGRGLIASGVATGGMIPKLETCLTAVEQGVEAAVILDGRVDHALLLEIFTETGAGTLIGA